MRCSTAWAWCLAVACGSTSAMAQDAAEAFARRERALPPEDARGRLALARWGLAHGAVGEARAVLRACVEADPACAEAQELLGRSRIGEAWLPPHVAAPRRLGLVPVEGVGWVAPRDEAHAREGWLPLEGRWFAPEAYAEARGRALRAWGEELRGQFDLSFRMSSAGPFDLALRTDDEARVARVARFLEEFHAAVHARFLPRPVDRPVRVILLSGPEEYRTLFPEVPPGAAAFYDWGVRRVVGYFGLDFGSLFHEVGHAYLECEFGARPPPWINEGFATFCEGCDRDAQGHVRHGLLNGRVWMARARLQAGRLEPLRGFLRDEALSAPGWDHSRAFSCYLHARGVLPDVLAAWGQGGADTSAEEILQRVLGADVGSVETDFHRWLLGLTEADIQIVPDP